MRFLVIEDDDCFAKILVNALQDRNYLVERACDGASARQYLAANRYDLLLVDVKLPDIDGRDFCRELRQCHLTVPIIFLTAYGSSHDWVRGLDSGADSYLSKPVDWPKLFAAIRALLRRSGHEVPEDFESGLHYGDLRLEFQSCAIYYRDRLLDLTPKQYLLLECFLRQPERVFDCQMLLERIYELDSASKSLDAVRSHIRNLRRQLEPVGLGDLIETVYGLGYRLNPEIGQSPSAPPLPLTDARAVQLQAQLESYWQEVQPSLEQDFALLADWSQQLAACAEQLPRVQQQVHNLKGLLGTLRREAAAEAAAELEQWLDGTSLLAGADSLAAKLDRLRAAIAPPPDLLVVSDDCPFNVDLQQIALQRRLRLRLAEREAGDSKLQQIAALQPQVLLLKSGSAQFWSVALAIAAACQPRPTFLLADQQPADLPAALKHAVCLPPSLNCTQILDRVQQAIAAGDR